MKQATRASDITSGRDERRRKNRRVSQSRALNQSFKGKRFGELTAEEKDDLLKAVALRLGMIRPD